MRQRDPAAHLWDISQASSKILDRTNNRTHADYHADESLRFIVERLFITIGEALHQLRRTNPEIAALIGDADAIIRFRHRLVHGYAVIDDDTVWDAVTNQLPLLVQEVDVLLQEHGDEQPLE